MNRLSLNYRMHQPTLFLQRIQKYPSVSYSFYKVHYSNVQKATFFYLTSHKHINLQHAVLPFNSMIINNL